jgi:hypothetical protein
MVARVLTLRAVWMIGPVVPPTRMGSPVPHAQGAGNSAAPHTEVDQLYDQCKNCDGKYHE